MTTSDTLSGVDLSNLQGHPDTWPRQPWYPTYLAADFVIIQTIEPPAGFPGHDFVDPETSRRGYTGVQLRQAQADGKKVGVYAWLWNGLADTQGNIRGRLECVPLSVRLDMRPWIDVEDTTLQAGVLSERPGRPEPHQRLNRQLQCEPRP